MQRGYMDLPCGCRAFVRPDNDGAPDVRRTYLCGRDRCLDPKAKAIRYRVLCAIAGGRPLTPCDGAWPHPIHGEGARAIGARIDAQYEAEMAAKEMGR